MNNYPAGVTDNDPYFTDESEIEESEPRSQANCVRCQITFWDTDSESALEQLARHARFH